MNSVKKTIFCIDRHALIAGVNLNFFYTESFVTFGFTVHVHAREKIADSVESNKQEKKTMHFWSSTDFVDKDGLPKAESFL